MDTLLNIGWDIDGVGHIFANGVMDFMDTIHHPYDLSYRGEAQSWNFHDRWGCSREEFKVLCDAGVDAGYVFRGHVHEGYFDAMRMVKEMGHRNIVITDRFFGTEVDGINPSHTATMDWFEENNALDLIDEIHFSANKLVVPTHFFIEDKLENYDALWKAGTKAFLINRPWNQVPGGGDARNRINELVDYVFAIEKATRDGFVDLAFA